MAPAGLFLRGFLPRLRPPGHPWPLAAVSCAASCRGLQGWHTDGDAWPKDRSLTVFKQWFDVQDHEVVDDFGRWPHYPSTAKNHCLGVTSRRRCPNAVSFRIVAAALKRTTKVDRGFHVANSEVASRQEDPRDGQPA